MNELRAFEIKEYSHYKINEIKMKKMKLKQFFINGKTLKSKIFNL